MRLLPATLALAASVACASGPRPRPVPPDGGGWREVRTGHFTLRTDLAPASARDLAAELEAVADGLERGLLGGRPADAVLDVDVVAFAREEDAEPFLPEGLRAATVGDPRSSRLTIVMPGAFGELQRALVAHELTHVLMAGALARQPPWFREGLACYAETLGWTGPDARLSLGRVPWWRVWPATPPAAAAIRALLLEAGRLDARQYSLAWGLVHFLVNTQGEAFEALQRRFAAGEDPALAWRATFPRWDPAGDGAAALRDALWAYLSRSLPLDVRPVRRLAGLPPARERALSAAEVHDVRLALPWRPSVSARLRDAEVEAGLARGSVAAAWLRAERVPGERRALAERAAREHPGDARAWLLLATAERTAAARETALERAVQADPGSAAARIALARFRVLAGRAEAALPDAQEAVRLAPWSPPALGTLAAVMEARGRCRDAIWLLRRAMENVPESERAAIEDPYRDAVAELERSCRAAP